MPSALEADLQEQLKVSMRAGDKVAMMAIRMVRTKVMERRTAKVPVDVTDELVVDVIRNYVKMLQGSIEELTAGGVGQDEDNVVQMRGEIAYLDRFLPKLLDEIATAALIDGVLAQHAIADAKMAGKATGLVMKEFKGQVDPGLVARLVRQKLGA
ncbi:MAG: hypothetical protein EXR79_01715 [Myxococcales bacterium]|nr:hypothetical protein [Myxococcales bacterium]